MDKTEILNRLDKVKFYQEFIHSLKVNGKPEALGLCPFHDDHHPSMSVNLESGLYYCHACGAGGDVFDFYQKLLGTDFATALSEIAEMAGVSSGADIPQRVTAKFKYETSDGQLLYAKERIEPGRDGRSKEFMFKHIVDSKWVSGRGGDAVLYNLPQVVKSKYCFIVEGEAKVDLLSSWGLTATCLDSGANSPLKEEHIKILRGIEKVVILPDSDKPGMAYAIRIANALQGEVEELKIVELQGLQKKEDVLDWSKIPGNNKEKLIELIKNTPLWIPTPESQKQDGVILQEKWEECQGILIADFPFPFEAFPRSMQKFIEEVAKSIGVDKSVVASSILAILSSRIGNTIRISPKRDWLEPLFIWMAVIADSGYGKSPLINTLMKPIEKLQLKAMEKYQEALEEYQTKWAIYERDYAEFKRGKKVNNPNAVSPPVKPQKPQPTHYKISDATIEAVADAFESTPRGFVVHHDELSFFINSLNQYKGKGGGDRQLWLSIWNAQSMKIDRKSTGTRYITNTGCSIIGGIQPLVLPDVFGNDSFADGMLGRFLVVHGCSNAGKFSTDSITDESLAYWEDLIDFCNSIPLKFFDDQKRVKPTILRLSGDAREQWRIFHDGCIESKQYLPNEAKGSVSKLTNYSLRIAGILCVIDLFENNRSVDVVDVVDVDLGHILKSTQLTSFYMSELQKLLKIYKNTPKETKTEEKNKTVIIKTLRFLQEEVKGGVLPVKRITEIFNTLLPQQLTVLERKTGEVLRGLGLITKSGNHGYSFLTWDHEKINKLFVDFPNIPQNNVNNINNVNTKPIVKDYSQPEDLEHQEQEPFNAMNDEIEQKNLEELTAFFEKQKPSTIHKE